MQAHNTEPYIQSGKKTDRFILHSHNAAHRIRKLIYYKIIAESESKCKSFA